MSIEALGWAIRQPVFPSNRKFVLVLLANYASDDWLSFPSVTTISSGTGLKRETVAKAIDSLIEDGFLKDTGKRCGDTGKIKVLELSGKVPNCPPVGSIQLSGNCPVIVQQLSGNCPIPGVPLIQGTRTGTRTVSVPPTLDEVKSYGSTISLPSEECEAFVDHFTSNGWRVSGKTPMKDWKAALRTWKRNQSKFSYGNHTNGGAGNGKYASKPSIVEERNRGIVGAESIRRAVLEESQSPTVPPWKRPGYVPPSAVPAGRVAPPKGQGNG